ncbi:hypothetical protein ACN38_g5397 [Penicillium nordicum]|uniref:Uncharacterized protein n=1 Tax=Penicillium nordicum TaxID=229535 RepID=A0A0M9WG89_9EURO|nr:hypothetical protein ACN38_g5397 [Penicillium nordicum]
MTGNSWTRILDVESGRGERREKERERDKLSTYVDLSHVGPRPQASRHPTIIKSLFELPSQCNWDLFHTSPCFSASSPSGQHTRLNP